MARQYSEAAAAAVIAASQNPHSWHHGFEGQHPDLDHFCCLDTATETRIIPNCMAFPLDNECFEGQVFLMIRTPDVDEKTPGASGAVPTHPQALKVSRYMKGRQRRFEFQFRVKLKKVPTGPLFLGCEVESPLKVSRLTKGLSNVLLAMIRRINSGFHYSWGSEVKADAGGGGSAGGRDNSSKNNNNSNSNSNNSNKFVTPRDYEEGNYEKSHLSFPVEASMDRIVITKSGETPPELGSELYESEASVKRRRKMGAGSVDWNTRDTYTMCLWSAYMDWIKWKSMNVPGVRPFSMSIVTATQPIYLSVYEVRDISNAEYRRLKPPHLRKSLNVYARLEFSHLHKTQGGLVQKLLDQSEVSIETESIITSESELFDRQLSIDDSVHSSNSGGGGTAAADDGGAGSNGADASDLDAAAQKELINSSMMAAAVIQDEGLILDGGNGDDGKLAAVSN